MKPWGERIALPISLLAALLAVYAIAFSLRMGMLDKLCHEHGYTEARARWNFSGYCRERGQNVPLQEIKNNREQK